MSRVEGLRRKASPGRRGEQSIGDLDGQYYRRDANSEPTSDNSHNIGSPSARLANIHSVTFTGTATTAEYADLAERYRSDCELEPGDVVKLGGDREITLSNKHMDTEVFGVVSSRPGFVLNEVKGEDDEFIGPPIGLEGRVPCKVAGPVKKGQYLVASSKPGCAEAINTTDLDEAWKLLCIVGRSLEDKDSHNTSLVEVVLGK